MPALPPPITSRTNARVKALRAALSGEARRPGDLLGLEGEHLLQEAHLAGLRFETIFVREGSEALLHGGWQAQLRTAQWAVLSPDVFDSAISTRSPQGLAATWSIAPVPQARAAGNVLVLEDLQDPGNLGTLVRSAHAFGFCKILITPETVNPWNPKVLRSAAGALFRVPVERQPLGEIMAGLRAAGLHRIAAVAGEPATLLQGASLRTPCALLIGNEGAGLSAEARRLSDEQVRIPCQAESLNAAVAGSILMYEAMRSEAGRPRTAHP